MILKKKKNVFINQTCVEVLSPKYNSVFTHTRGSVYCVRDARHQNQGLSWGIWDPVQVVTVGPFENH